MKASSQRSSITPLGRLVIALNICLFLAIAFDGRLISFTTELASAQPPSTTSAVPQEALNLLAEGDEEVIKEESESESESVTNADSRTEDEDQDSPEDEDQDSPSTGTKIVQSAKKGSKSITPLSSSCEVLALTQPKIEAKAKITTGLKPCKRRHIDRPRLAVAVILQISDSNSKDVWREATSAVTNVKQLASDLAAQPGAWKGSVEVLVLVESHAKSAAVNPQVVKKLRGPLKGENDFLIYSAAGRGRGCGAPANRLLRFTPADHLLLLSQPHALAFGASDQRKAVATWAQAALEHMSSAAPSPLAFISASPSPNKTTPKSKTPKPLPGVRVAAGAPVLVQRLPALDVGGADEALCRLPAPSAGGPCPTAPPLHLHWTPVMSDLASRLVLSGYAAAAIPAPPAAMPPAAAPDETEADTFYVEAAERHLESGQPEEEDADANGQSGWTEEEERRIGLKSRALSKGVVVNCVPQPGGGDVKALTHAGPQSGGWGGWEKWKWGGIPAPPSEEAQGEGGRCGEEGRAAGAPVASLVMQYFQRPQNINRILSKIRQMKVAVEVIVNNDSLSDDDKWMKEVAACSKSLVEMTIVYSHDLHEIRAYNRAGQMAQAELVVLMQDDDVPGAPEWLGQALFLFRKYPQMALLGGYRGRMDDGKKMKPNNSIDGAKYGAEYKLDKLRVTKKITSREPEGKFRFLWVYKVNMGPLLVRRSSLLHLGAFNANFSCAGDPGIGFDFEYSIRVWAAGGWVGLYDPFWNHHIHAGGTTSSLSKGSAKKNPNAPTFVNEKRNNLQLYKMYPDFHHEEGTAVARRPWGNLTWPKNLVPKTKDKRDISL